MRIPITKDFYCVFDHHTTCLSSWLWDVHYDGNFVIGLMTLSTHFSLLRTRCQDELIFIKLKNCLDSGLVSCHSASLEIPQTSLFLCPVISCFSYSRICNKIYNDWGVKRSLCAMKSLCSISHKYREIKAFCMAFC